MSSAIPSATPGEYSYLPIERVHFGQGCVAKLRAELDRLGSVRPFVVTGHTIATRTDLVAQVELAAGRKLVGVFSEIKQHSPESGITRALEAAKDLGADTVISLGGGSPIDATKIVVKEMSEDFHLSPIPHIAFPTTLSAAEFSHSAGMTDETLNRKVGFRDVRMVPRLVFLDPRLTLPTPSWLWASTGMRSLDHAVESITSLKNQPYTDTLALQAIRLLFENLKKSANSPNDFDARMACQIAAWMSNAGALSVGTGLSHAIGRAIGATWNIPHGITSCLTLAEVMRMEAKRTPKKLAMIASAEGRSVEGLSVEKAALEAAEGVAELVRGLGLSKKLRDYNIDKSELPKIAEEVGVPQQDREILNILDKIW